MANIVIIEDTPANLELMSYLLESFGHNVFTAIDGGEGLKLVRKIIPELVICDVHLPKLDGYEVARSLKSDPNLCAIPLLAVTALAMVGDREKGMNAGFDGYLYKPIEPESFVSEVEAFLHAERYGVSPLRPLVQEAQIGSMLSSRHGRILIVDDSQVNRELSRDMLQPLGYEVWLTESAAEGYAFACRYKPDLIISDLHMPEEDGFSLYRRLQEDPQLAAIPFVICSSSVLDKKAYEKAGKDHGIRLFMRPIEPEAILEAIKTILAERPR